MTADKQNHRTSPSSFRRQVEKLKAEVDFERVFERMAEIERSFTDLGLRFEPWGRSKQADR